MKGGGDDGWSWPSDVTPGAASIDGVRNCPKFEQARLSRFRDSSSARDIEMLFYRGELLKV